MPGGNFIPTRLNDLFVDVLITSAARGDVLFRGASKWNNLAAGTAGQALVMTDIGGGVLEPRWAAGGSLAAPGSDTQVQFNDGGAFGGDAGLVFNKTTNVLTVAGGVRVPTSPDNASPTFSNDSTTTNGLGFTNSGEFLTWMTGTYPFAAFDNSGFRISHVARIGFCSDYVTIAGPDLGLLRKSAGVLAITNGTSTGAGALSVPTPASGAGNSLTVSASDAASGNTNGGDFIVQLAEKSGSGMDGKAVFRAAGGTPGTHEIQAFFYAPTVALLASGTNYIALSDNTNRLSVGNGQLVWENLAGSAAMLYANSSGSSWVIKSDADFGWAQDTNAFSGKDTGLTRAAAGVARVTNGSSGVGMLLAGALVEANTAGSGSPNILTAAESRTVLTNEGTSAENYHTLPTATAGLEFKFYCQDTDGIRITAAAGDTIRMGSVVSAAAGYIKSVLPGSYVRLYCINATEWIAAKWTGLWQVDGVTVGRVVAPIVALVDAATIATDAALSNQFSVTLGDNRTLGNPTNAVDGQRITWAIKQDGTGSRTLAYDTKFRFGTDITGATLTTTANKTDYLTVIYRSGDDKFDVVGFIKGY